MEKYINRAITKTLIKKLRPNKVMVILGARRTGKTSLLRHLKEEELQEPFLDLNGEDMATVEILKQRTVENYKRLIGKNRILIIDEAQKIPGIGSILKLIVDNIDGIKIIVTGSSVFDLSNKIGEPLTGRKQTFYLFPFSQMEFSTQEHAVQTRAKLEERLIFGCYPELLQYESNEDKSAYLQEIVSSYLLKDILEFDGVRNSSKIMNLLQLISFQIGNEVSLEELGRQLNISRNTVEKYLDLLSKVFVIYKLPGFSRNLRNEVTKTSKWYFYDNGIRNALILNFNPLNLRNDTGELWENYCITERLKYQHYKNMLVKNYFWRTYQQHEIDFVEERQGQLFAFEIKWNPNKKVKIPAAWQTAYPDSTNAIITKENYLEWIT